jgi:hypothetical protein
MADGSSVAKNKSPVRCRELQLNEAFTVVARAGIEPATYRFSGGRSYQLSYLARRRVARTAVNTVQHRRSRSPCGIAANVTPALARAQQPRRGRFTALTRPTPRAATPSGGVIMGVGARG